MDAVAHAPQQEHIVAPPGLSGVIVADTAISDIHAAEGWYQYRDRSATALARTTAFEDVWHLLLIGELPDVRRARAFRDQITTLRGDASLREIVAPVVRTGTDPVAVLQAAWPLVAAARRHPSLYDLDERGRIAVAVELAAAAPVVIALAHRPDVSPVVTGDGIVADHLRAVADREPDAWEVGALSAYLVCAMDHGFNASTFAARVIASTGAGLACALAGALGALSGPLHGGAPSRALDALDRFDDVDAIEPWVRAELAAGRRLMGFGHAVYRTADPRAVLLREVAAERGGRLVETAIAYQDVAERVLAELRPGRALHANVELFAAVVMAECGIPRPLMTPTFALARTIGWSAHALEQARERKIIRPSARFTGPRAR